MTYLLIALLIAMGVILSRVVSYYKKEQHRLVTAHVETFKELRELSRAKKCREDYLTATLSSRDATICDQQALLEDRGGKIAILYEYATMMQRRMAAVAVDRSQLKDTLSAIRPFMEEIFVVPQMPNLDMKPTATRVKVLGSGVIRSDS